MVRCPHCGVDTGLKDVFCAQCGSPLTAQGNTSPRFRQGLARAPVQILSDDPLPASNPETEVTSSRSSTKPEETRMAGTPSPYLAAALARKDDGGPKVMEPTLDRPFRRPTIDG